MFSWCSSSFTLIPVYLLVSRWPPAAPCLLSSVLRLSPFSSFPPIGVCSPCTAIHQACHWSLRGGWRRLRGTWLISLLWLSRAAQQEQAPATRAFTSPFSTYSYSHFCFPRFIPPLSQCNYCTPLFLPDLVTSPFPFLQPSIDQHVCCMCEKNRCSENLCAAPNQAARMLQFY